MSWRSQGITGSNNIPLGNRRRFGGEDGSPPAEESYSSGPVEGDSLKRGRSPVRGMKVTSDLSATCSPSSAELNPDGTKKRKKRNRWGDATDNKAAGLMNLPTAVLGNMTSEQLDAYTLHLRIEEISQKLRINDVVPADGDRSPSPPPQYDNFGRRVNTREYRYKKRLEEERHKLVEKAMKTIPGYHPPSDYRRPTKTQEKVYVPVNDYPEINFIGLLIGPRGNTLKKMETESGAKIAIRGKGSVKEGKGRSDAAHTSNQEEDLHCLIMADTEDKVNKAKQLIHNVIETVIIIHLIRLRYILEHGLTPSQAASIPEGQNELKRNQLRELAALNGTLRDDENQACQNCGQIGHRKYDCPEQRNFTANIICRVCGNAGHMARDCPDRQRGQDWRNSDRPAPGAPGRPAGQLEPADTEFNNLMQELVLAAPLLEAQPLLASKLVDMVMTAELPSPGNVDLQEVLLPGSKVVVAAAAAAVASARVAARVDLHHGRLVVLAEAAETTTMEATVVATLLAVQLHGSNSRATQHLKLKLDMEVATVVMAMAERPATIKATDRQQHPAWHHGNSRAMAWQEALHLLPLPAMLLPHLPPSENPPLLPHQALERDWHRRKTGLATL
ncbi:unnamed protein product, partial [Aureobasidium vineae]